VDDVKSAYEKTFDILSSFQEGLTCEELQSLDTDGGGKKISALLSLMVHEGLAKKAGFKINPETGHNVSIYAPLGTRFDERVREKRAANRKRRRPTDQELLDLREWKRLAIIRFPELGVDPMIAKARKQVAEIYRSDGNATKAAMVESGNLDDGDSMRIALAIMGAS
jgi:hypothetical protein